MAQRVTRKKNRKRLFWLLFLLSLAGVIVIFSSGHRGFIQQIRRRIEQARLKEEIQMLEADQADKEKQIEKLHNPEEIEKIAREEYGMAKENEKIYRVVPKEKK